MWTAADERPLLTLGIGLLAGVALLLMLAGFHGMTGHALAGRSREFAIRIALGSTPLRLLVESSSGAAGVYVTGVAVGFGLILCLRAIVRATVFVPPGVQEPALASVGTAAAVLMGLVIAVACYRPIRRAIATDPATTLRAE